MTEDEDKAHINPSWIIQSIIALLIGGMTWMINYHVTEIKNGQRDHAIQIMELRQNLVELEIGLRGDRFSRTDWNAARQELFMEIRELEQRVRELEQRIRELEQGD